MWLAAGSSPVGLDPTQVIIAITTLLTAVVAAVAGVIVAILNSRSKQQAAPPPTALDPDDWAYVRERVATCEARINDLADAAEISDRRHDVVERLLDVDNQYWGHNGPRRK